MTEVEDTLGSRTVCERVRETLLRAPVFHVERDLPSHWCDLLDELDRVFGQREADGAEA